MKRTALLLLFPLVLLWWSSTNNETTTSENPSYKTTLSEYGFFTGKLAELQPAEGVLPYELNSPLFSDYAYKARFLHLPAGTQATYDAEHVLSFPVGTAIIKNFYYPADFRKPEGKRRILETRLLLHEENGWVALPYIWNDEQTEAYLEVAGGKKQIEWKDQRGKKKELEYSIPNFNQCKGCHLRNKEVVPIGPSARQLNRDFIYADGKQNQLVKLHQLGWLPELPDLQNVPKMANWQDAASGSLDERARAYLDVNCGHCHNPNGPANTSGLFLSVHEQDPTKWGVNKAPIAAGRGSGDRLFNIVPGKPDASILVYRMESTDPGVMMPEVSRKLLHEEGLALIKEWIKNMR